MHLSKSRLLAHLQCPKRLWLEVHRPQVGVYTDATRARLESGQHVGEVARQLYAQGREIGVASGTDDWLSFDSAQGDLFPRAAGGGKVFFEATFRHEDVQVRADVLEYSSGRTRLIEVKSGSRVKEEYVPDVAIQSWVINGVGVRLDEIAVAHLNSKFVYPGNTDYRGLLVEVALGDLASQLMHQVAIWARTARHTLEGSEPTTPVGQHCRKPHECPFVKYCWPRTEYPLTVLPKLGARLDEYVAHGYRDVRDVPEQAISGVKQLRVWRATVTGQAHIEPALGEELRGIPRPRYYLDFEAIEFAVPIWAGTRPRQAIPFQWSVDLEQSGGQVEHREYLDLSGEFPAPNLAQALLDALGTSGPIVVYSRYEQACIETLAQLVPPLADALRALVPRLVDVLPLFQRHYYHPAMKGSWSIKAILPTVAPAMRYQDLGEIREGNAAQQAYLEAIHPSTPVQRRDEIARLLLEYCRLDTQALLHLLQTF